MAKDTETRTVPRPQLDAGAWDAFIAASPQGANYAHTWYLDVVWPGWQAIQVFYKNELHAVMPVRVSRKYGVRYCFTPAMSQYGGVFFAGGSPLDDKREEKNEKVLALKKRLVTAIVEAIPATKKFVLNLAPEFDYPLPFHWAGYELHTRFTYWLDNSSDKKLLFKNCHERTRTYIRKAQKSGLTAKLVTDAADIIRLSQERDAYPLDYALLGQLWEALRANGVGHAIEVRDGDGRLHAGLIQQKSGEKNQHLFSAIDPEVRNMGGMSLAIWHSLETAGEDIRTIDFEGSMLEPVEKFFRGFGPRPVSYLQVRKNSLPKVVRLVTSDQ